MVDVVPVAITGAILVAALGGMTASWRLRHRRQSDLELPAASGTVPGHGTAPVEADGLYLATTFAGRPLDRVVAAGLGFRAQAHLVVDGAGLVFDRVGSTRIVLPATALDGAGIATWTIDRAVEPGGLTIVAWSLQRGGERVPVESAFRLEPEPRAHLIAAVRALVAVRAHPEGPDA